MKTDHSHVYESFSAPQGSLGAPPRLHAPAPLAGRGQRLQARIADQVIYVLAMLPAGFTLFEFLMMSANPENKLGPIGLGGGALAALLFSAVLAINLRMLSDRGQTIGKAILGVRIVGTDGARLSLGRIIGRRVAPVLLMSLIPGLGNVVALLDGLFIFRDDRRCIHDMLAESKVIKVS